MGKRLFTDEQAAGHGCLRVIDESGENYACAADRLLHLELSPQIEETLLTVL